MRLDGSDHQVLAQGLDRSVSGPVWASDGSGLYFQYDDAGNSKVAFVSLGGGVEVLAEHLGGTSYGRPYGGGSFSVARDGSFALNQTRPHLPGEVATGRRGGGDVRRLTSLNDDLLANKRLGDVEEIWWESSFDDRPIQGWIVKPPGFDPGQRYPLVLEIHGGPVSNYGDRFSAEMQLLAASGYVVLYANPRGSTSYGEEFADLLYHNYPGQDYDDLMSGVDAVIARGYIDEDNLFVTGGSAGGIMTAWIVRQNRSLQGCSGAKAGDQLDQQDANCGQLVRLLPQPLRRTALGEPGRLLGVLAAFAGRKRQHPDFDCDRRRRSAHAAVRVVSVLPCAQAAGNRDRRDPAAGGIPRYEPPAQPADRQDREHRGVVRQVPDEPDRELARARLPLACSRGFLPRSAGLG